MSLFGQYCIIFLRLFAKKEGRDLIYASVQWFILQIAKKREPTVIAFSAASDTWF